MEHPNDQLKPMNILFVLPQIPYPPHSGGRIVTWNTIKRFAEMASVSIVALYHHPSELEALEKLHSICDEVHVFQCKNKWSVPVLLRSMLSRWPYKAHRFFNPAMAQKVNDLVEQHDFDIVHCQNFYTAAYRPKSKKPFCIHYKENVEGNILLRYAGVSNNPLVKLAGWLEGHRTRRYELQACRNFNRVLTISPHDQKTLLQLDSTLPIQHQCPGVDLAEYPYLDEPRDTNRVVFTGTMSYYPNSTGISTFLQKIWPRVLEQVPDACFDIVGASPPDEIRAYDGHDGIQVTGRVDRIQDYIEDATVYIVPLYVGGGIRLKILEAMASGRAIVSTSIGCEGLDGQHDKHLLVADKPEAFADSVITLLQNAQKREALRRNARALVEEVYDWDKVISQQIACYQDWLTTGC